MSGTFYKPWCIRRARLLSSQLLRVLRHQWKLQAKAVPFNGHEVQLVGEQVAQRQLGVVWCKGHIAPHKDLPGHLGWSGSY
jgi:hypothetical protein